MGQRLRIVSANLWNGGADPDAFAQQVIALGADVVAVQEISPEQAEALGAVMPHGLLEPARDYCGMGIALRHPTEISHIPLDYRPARRVRLCAKSWPGLERPVEVLNLHLAAPHVSLLGRGFLHRARQTRALTRYLTGKPAEARVLVGDLNSTPGWPAYHRIASHFTDASVAVAKLEGRRALPTWGPTAGAPRLLRIDHGFVSGVRAESFEVVDVLGSDHSAVVMDISV